MPRSGAAEEGRHGRDRRAAAADRAVPADVDDRQRPAGVDERRVPDGPRWARRPRDRATRRARGLRLPVGLRPHADGRRLGATRRRRPPAPAALGIGTWDAWALLAGLGSDDRGWSSGRWSRAPAYQNPARLAKLADTIDEISGGRLIAGPGCRRPLERVPAVRRPDSSARSHGSRRRCGSSCRCCARVASTSRASSTPRATASSRRGVASRGRRSSSGRSGPGPRMVRLVATYADLWNGWYTFDDDEPPLPGSASSWRASTRPAWRSGRDPATSCGPPACRWRCRARPASGGSIRGTARADRRAAARDRDDWRGASPGRHVAGRPRRRAEGMARVLEHLDRAPAPA